MSLFSWVTEHFANYAEVFALRSPIRGSAAGPHWGFYPQLRPIPTPSTRHPDQNPRYR